MTQTPVAPQAARNRATKTQSFKRHTRAGGWMAFALAALSAVIAIGLTALAVATVYQLHTEEFEKAQAAQRQQFEAASIAGNQ